MQSSCLSFGARPDSFLFRPSVVRLARTVFKRCNALLSGHGYFAFSTFGKENLKEIAAVTGSGLHYYSLEELKKSLSMHYNIVTAGEERIRLTFATPLDVLYHLKHTGVTAVCRQAWTKGGFAGVL